MEPREPEPKPIKYCPIIAETMSEKVELHNEMDWAWTRPDPPVSIILRFTDVEMASTPQQRDPPVDPPPSEDEGPRHARPSHCLWCWRAMDDHRLFASILMVLAVWIGGLGYWSFYIMDIKCFRDVGPTAIEWITLPAFLAIAALILNSANCALSCLLGSVPTNPEPPYSQDQRDRQVWIYDALLICIVWTIICIFYFNLPDQCHIGEDDDIEIDDDGGFGMANATAGHG